MEIRKLTNCDLDAYLKLRFEMLNENSNEIDNLELEKQTREYFVDNINKSLIIFGMFDQNILIAVSGIEIIKRLPNPKINNINSTIGYICGVYTDKSYRKQGISKKLLNRTLQFGKDLGITRFKLSSSNPIAIKMYESLGFKHNEKAMTLTL